VIIGKMSSFTQHVLLASSAPTVLDLFWFYGF
jgi:hypothetical protein